ncbi:MAG: NAD-dependent epimerase/dehydratase family protein [Candidatus Hodarchaeaceae archaeon]|nr:NAD-dependent epimerase/dehydratase family protein [Candidatus Hodarchaeaceae archaeon]
MILVAGGAGFIGSHLIDQLVDGGYVVRVADDFSKGRRENIENHEGKPNFEMMHADFTDYENCKKVIDDIDIMFLLASKIGGIGYFHKYPAEIIDANTKIVSNLLNAARRADVQRILYISSSMVFERAAIFPTPERALERTPVPITSYGFSKLIGEWFCRAFWEEHGLKYTILRPFNCVGPREHPEEEPGMAHVIPDLTKKILRGDYPLEIYGDGLQTRCFTNVKDTVRAFVLAMKEKKAVCEDFNIGNPEETRIKDLAEMLWKICGRKEPFKLKHLPSFEHDVQRRVPDITKAKKILKWKPRTPLEKTLQEYVGWYKSYR